MPVKKDARALGRSDVRYRLYRIANGNPMEPKDGLQKHFETQDEFDGWQNFSATWDVGPEGEWPDGHFVAVSRARSLAEEWQRTMLGLAQPFPGAEPASDPEAD